jgi:hypothetical protein
MRGLAGVLAALLVSVASVVWAQPPVNLEIVHCDTLDEQEVARIFAAELGASLHAGHLPQITRVAVECARHRAVLRVKDPVTRKGVSRAVALDKDAPETHARLVAIAATELVLASWAELEFNPEPRVPPAGEEPPPEVSEAARRTVAVHQAEAQGKRTGRRRRRDEPPPTELRFLVLGSSRVFFAHRAAFFGGGLRAAAELSDTVSWWVDLVSEGGTATFELKEYDVWLGSAGAGLMFFRRWGATTVRLGGGLRAGATGGSSLDAGSGSDPEARRVSKGQAAMLGWPLAMGSLSSKLGRAVVVELTAESSYMWAPTEQPALTGIWLAGQAGIGISL